MHPSLLITLILLAQANTALMTGGPTQTVFGVKYFTNSNLRVNNTSVPDAAINYQTLTNYVTLFGGGGTIKTGDYVHIFRANSKGLVYAVSNQAYLVSSQLIPFGFYVTGNVIVDGDLAVYGSTVTSEMIFNNNSKLTATNAFWVTAPHFRSIKGTNLLANGVWDFTGATVLGLSPNLIFRNTNVSAGLVFTNANVVLIGTNVPASGLQGNGYTNELGTVGGFYIAVTNGLVEAIAYSPVLYSGGNTGLVSDANWAGVGTNFTGSGAWTYNYSTRTWTFVVDALKGNGYTNTVGPTAGFHIIVTNGLVYKVSYNPILYSGGNTGLVSDANWIGVGTNFVGSGTWTYNPATRTWQYTAPFLQGNGYTNELGTAGGFYIAVTNGLVEAVAYSPVLYSGGNTGLMWDGAWSIGTNALASTNWVVANFAPVTVTNVDLSPYSLTTTLLATSSVLQAAIDGKLSATVTNAGITGISNGVAVAAGIVTNFAPLEISGFGAGTAQAVSIVVVRPTDWVWGRGGSTISNAIAPVWFHQRTAARSVSGLSWVSAATTGPHGRYMSAEPQFLELAHDWGTNWAFRIWLSASTTSVDTNRFDVRVTAPNGEQWSTNNYTVAQANTILPLDVPTNAFSAYMVGSGATNRWVIEMEVWSRAGTSSTVHNVESILKVIR